MTRRRLAVVVSGLALWTHNELLAQVGYPPQRSPYRDLQETQEVSFFSGYYRAKLDPARVAPRSGPIVGIHYQWRSQGPVNLTADFSRVTSERRVLDPERSATCAAANRECKYLGTFRWPLYIADAGLALSATGARSFFRLVPDLRVGVGIATDFHTRADVGDFGFGTRFAFNGGVGIRWVPGGRYQIRADFMNHLYSVKYPEKYYQAADDGTVIFDANQSRTAWLNNPGITIGVSYLFSR
jgi:hypothetical protein